MTLRRGTWAIVLASTVLFGQQLAAYADSATTQTPTDVASQAAITFIQVTGTPDAVFGKLEQRYRPAGNSLSDPTKWAGFCRQGGRNITFNLGGFKYVSSVSLSFQKNPSGGVSWPGWIHALTSQDGHYWSLFGGGQDTVSTKGNVETITVSSSQPVMASYLKLIFPVSKWVFPGQLHVWSVDGSTTPPVTPPYVTPGTPGIPKGFLTPGYVNTVHHMLLVYTGANGQLGQWSPQDFVPMLDYINDKGIAEERMFDSILFIPYDNAGATASGWNQYLDDLFAPNGELANLNAGAVLAGQKIFTNTIENMVFSIPFPPASQSQFGSLQSGQPNLDFNPADPGIGAAQSLQNREAAVAWYYQEFMSRWKQSNFSNLRLSGVYWNDEDISVGTDDAKLIQYVRGLTTKDNLSLLWIPYYGVNAVDQWSQLGLDGAILQSNYYQIPLATTDRIQQTVDKAYRDGLGLELEVDGDALVSPSQAARYQTELQTFANNLPANSDAVEAFYDGSKVLLKASQSSDPSVRAMYDATGRWVELH